MQIAADDILLTRNQAADVLTAAGFPISAATLATRVSRGGGPVYRLFGKRALYRRPDLLAWAASRMSPPRASSSEAA